jgi:hypothetical protein
MASGSGAEHQLQGNDLIRPYKKGAYISRT